MWGKVACSHAISTDATAPTTASQELETQTKEAKKLEEEKTTQQKNVNTQNRERETKTWKIQNPSQLSKLITFFRAYAKNLMLELGK